MIPAGRPRHNRVLARLAAAFVVVAVVAACGTATATPSHISSRSATPASGSSVPTSSSTATPSISIVPVPTSQQAAPASPATHLDAATATALQAALDSIRSDGRYPGISAAIVFPDGQMWTAVSGTAILSSGTKVAVDTVFSIASISKTIVAALVCRLAMAGTISLDDHLDQYVPDFPRAAGITVRQLLTHTTGIRDLFQDLGPAIVAHPSRIWTAQQVLAGIANKPWCSPGKCYHYSNTDYILLGLVIEKATGQKVSKLVRDAFLEPLGLDHTYLQTEERVQGALAHGYVGSGSKPADNYDGSMLPFTSEATAVGVSGAYVSTASDLAIWGNALYGGDVLDRATLADMVDISPTLPYAARSIYGHSIRVGLGLEETSIAGQVTWGHLGSLDGFLSNLAYFPAYHVTVVVLINANWANPLAASTTLAQIAMGKTG
jgi:D-alanyl-D-alanine carboxypeptidase